MESIEKSRAHHHPVPMDELRLWALRMDVSGY